MKATSESSAPYQNALDRTVPSLWQSQLRADLTELQRLRDELERGRAEHPVPDPDKLQAMQDRARHAGAKHSDDIHRAIGAAIEDHRLQLPLHLWKSRRSRAEWLKRLMGEGAPGWRTIDNQLKTLSL